MGKNEISAIMWTSLILIYMFKDKHFQRNNFIVMNIWYYTEHVFKPWLKQHALSQ